MLQKTEMVVLATVAAISVAALLAAAKMLSVKMVLKVAVGSVP